MTEIPIEIKAPPKTSTPKKLAKLKKQKAKKATQEENTGHKVKPAENAQAPLETVSQAEQEVPASQPFEDQAQVHPEPEITKAEAHSEPAQVLPAEPIIPEPESHINKEVIKTEEEPSPGAFETIGTVTTAQTATLSEAESVTQIETDIEVTDDMNVQTNNQPKNKKISEKKQTETTHKLPKGLRITLKVLVILAAFVIATMIGLYIGYQFITKTPGKNIFRAEIWRRFFEQIRALR